MRPDPDPDALPTSPPGRPPLGWATTQELVRELSRRSHRMHLVIQPRSGPDGQFLTYRHGDAVWLIGALGEALHDLRLMLRQPAPPMPGPGDHPTDLSEGGPT